MYLYLDPPADKEQLIFFEDSSRVKDNDLEVSQGRQSAVTPGIGPKVSTNGEATCS